MKANTSPRVKDADTKQELIRHAIQINALSEGKLSGTYNAQAAAPTTGTYAAGDFIRNSTPTELGIGGGKYVVEGWLYVGGVFLEKRFLTGN